MKEPLHILKNWWGYDAFRPMQEDIIRSVLEGKDVLALMPTGGGKSLCYQVPAMAMDGICLVISPLIALMKDQVENLRKRGITAYAIYSGMSRKEVISTFETVAQSNCKFLYVSPERLETALFREYLPGLGIELIAVDEAHCISQWGYDFRPPYLRIAAIREELAHVPILALTASATPEVQEDICRKLELRDEKVFRQSFERPNLSYSCIHSPGRISKVADILQKVPGTAIVYCKSRRRTKEVADWLRLQGIEADYYHAGLSQEERSRKQEDWIRNKIRVIVCTNAFGMGIDKPDVRTVIHADIPDCLENYYQEAGRAGRDGNRAYAVLLYDDQELIDLSEKAGKRFPTLDEIRQVYQAVANYFQLPSGSGEGQYFTFDLADFSRKFNLQTQLVINAMKALEQDGWLAFNEQVFLPPRVVFTVQKHDLYEFEQLHPETEPLIKILLRSYEGIYDQAVPVSELMIAGLLKAAPENVIRQLELLDRAGIISYQARTDKPQVFWLRARIKTEDVRIDMQAFLKRKEQYERRMQQMLRYVNEEKDCRSRIIAAYFGDANVKDCGICDNCLRRNSAEPGSAEFEQIRQLIYNLLSKQPMDSRELLDKMSKVKKEKAWKVLQFLQAENKIEMDKSGRLILK